jgi:D-sedoheptulose 7-phosphate isomerase
VQDWVLNRIQSIESAFTESYCQAIDRVIDELTLTFKSGRKLLICGNGGSAADAQHIAGELVGRFLKIRKGLPAIAIVSDSATMTAIANDLGSEYIFARQVEALGNEGDMLMAISTSGKSKNILLAMQTAKETGISTIGLAGNNGGLMQDLTDHPLFVGTKETPRIQEIHLLTYHYICEKVEEKVFEN